MLAEEKTNVRELSLQKHFFLTCQNFFFTCFTKGKKKKSRKEIILARFFSFSPGKIFFPPFLCRWNKKKLILAEPLFVITCVEIKSDYTTKKMYHQNIRKWLFAWLPSTGVERRLWADSDEEAEKWRHPLVNINVDGMWSLGATHARTHSDACTHSVRYAE